MVKVYKINNVDAALSGAELIAHSQRICAQRKSERPTTIKESVRSIRALGYTVMGKEKSEKDWKRI